MGKFQEKLGINELMSKDGKMWRAVLAEFTGNLLLNFFGCGAVINIAADNGSSPPNLVLIGLTFGLTVFMIISTIGHVSGGHVNPAVTAGVLAAGKISIARAVLYVIAQCMGAVAGSAILKALTPEAVAGKLGLTSVGKEVSSIQGFGIEFFLGFVLVLVVFGVCDEHKPDSKFMAPLAIGMTVTLGHLMAIDYTGSSMNPARSFGSAVIAGDFENHWIYWVGPILGGIAASLVYCQGFAAPPPQRYSLALGDEKEMKRLDGNGSKHDELP
ncbi:aquaporin prip [Arctopsyche grandis]|uniref:aquaporin prip n=1 Tax=Arctopsyche grandis TaxID=121162 RepID=UPI00406D9C8C